MSTVRAPRDPLRAGLIGLVVVAALAAGWFGFSWFSAAQDVDLSYGRERDAVLQAAGPALATLHTIDHRSASRDIDRWLQVSVGELRRDLAGDRDGEAKRARTAKAAWRAELVRAAVTDLDANAGTASVIAVVDVTRTRASGKPSTERRRMNADLLRSDGRWKVAAVEAAA